jgi:predicted  nucleic acid-binding Zn-ribbon protein
MKEVWVKNLVRLLVIVLSIAGGYFIGDYRGKEARKALERAMETGKAVVREREATIAALRKDLDAINGKYDRDIDAMRHDYTARTAAWEREKSALDETIGRMKTDLDERKRNIAGLKEKLAKSTDDAEKKGLEQEVARQEHIIADLERRVDGNVCLQIQVPRSVLDALGEADGRGSL